MARPGIIDPSVKRLRKWRRRLATGSLLAIALTAGAASDRFHNARLSAGLLKNPFVGKESSAVKEDATLNTENCATCHGKTGYGKQFTAEFSGQMIASQHGAWNKSVRVGHKVIRAKMRDGKSTDDE